MSGVNRASSLPDRDRLSVLIAVIVLAYALTRFLDLPSRVVSVTLFGSALGLELNGAVLMLALVAALISAASDTVIRSHPAFADAPARHTLMHWVLPGATALVLGAALNRAPDGPVWWLGLGGSAAALVVVLMAEYVLVDPAAPRRETAALTLTGLAYALALILFSLLHSLSRRAAISSTIGGAAAAVLAWRLFTLRAAPLARAAVYATVTGLICAEAIWALNYWRAPSTSAALLVMIPFYLSVGLTQQHLAGRLTRRVWVEYVVVGGLGLSLGLFYTLARR
jgi:hypothetical protein